MYVTEPTERELENIRKWQENLTPPIPNYDELHVQELARLKQKAAEYDQAQTLLTVTVLDPVVGDQVLPSVFNQRVYDRAVAASLAKPVVPMTDAEMRLAVERDRERLAGLARIRERNAVDASRSVDLGRVGGAGIQTR
jgi:hypothetical protein